jgi:hypothetical protein
VAPANGLVHLNHTPRGALKRESFHFHSPRRTTVVGSASP